MLAGKVVAITGRLSKTKEEYGKLIAAHGGTLSNTVTKKTTHIIAGNEDGASSKLDKARKYGIQICNEEFLLSLEKGEKYNKEIIITPKAKEVVENVTKMANPPEVLLAETYDLKKNGNMIGWWVSEKLDGVRSWWDGENFWSRLGNKFYAPDWFRAQMPTNCILDGELFIGRGKFKETVSIVKSHSKTDAWHQITFMIFDIPSEANRPFEERITLVNEICAKANSKNIQAVNHQQVTANSNINKMLSDIEEVGGEGLMFRQPTSMYIGKRSKTLIKMKSFKDEEATIIGYATEGQGRLAGTTGSLLVRDADGIEFKVGSGLDDETRKTPPPVGTLITYRYQEKQSSGKPRFPVYVGIAIDKK